MNTDSISQDLRRFDRGFCTCVSQRATRRRWHIGLDSFVAAAPPPLHTVQHNRLLSTNAFDADVASF